MGENPLQRGFFAMFTACSGGTFALAKRFSVIAVTGIDRQKRLNQCDHRKRGMS
jgi:hypothetical protein